MAAEALIQGSPWMVASLGLCPVLTCLCWDRSTGCGPRSSVRPQGGLGVPLPPTSVSTVTRPVMRPEPFLSWSLWL